LHGRMPQPHHRAGLGMALFTEQDIVH